MRHVALGFALLIAASVPAFAQVAGTGTIQGTVTDPSGAAVAGASVTALNVATGLETVRKSTEAGLFVLPLLIPGEYTVTVKATGFETLTQQHVIVDALANVAVNPRMTIGAASVAITVEASPTVLKTDDVTLGTTMENNVYDSLPLAMNAGGSPRDPSAFAGLAVGVDNYSTQAAGPSTGSFNGGQTYQNEVYIEGLPLTSAGTESDTRNLAFGVSVEAVEQFQVETAGAKAMYEGQGVSNYVLKSGTNQFHGGVFEYFRNTDFDARNFFSATLPVDHQNEFGVNFSGPIVKNKLFIFGNYDGYRFLSAYTPGLQTIPTVAERGGDFSAILPASGTNGVIYDPSSATGQGVRTPFPNNVIPTSRISAISQSFQSYLPPPTNSSLTNNYLAMPANKVNNDSTTDKLDYSLTDNNRLFALYSTGKYAQPTVGSYSGASTSGLPVPYLDGRGVIEYATTAQIHDSQIISPSLVNQASISVSRMFIPLTSNTFGGNYPGKAGLTGLPGGVAGSGFPDITFSGGVNTPVSWDGTNSHAYNEAQNTIDFQENVLWTKGRHNVTFGFQWQSLQDNENTPLTGTQAGFTFSNAETENFGATGTAVANTGLPYASFLLGAVNSSTVTQNAVAETGGRYKTYAFYAQDDFKVNRKLTLNLGLRWNIWSPFSEVNGVMSWMDPTVTNPALGIPGALVFAGSGSGRCGCSTPIKQHNVNPGPRVGLAYQLDSKTVVRASYSIFYSHAGGVGGRANGRQGLSQLGFNETQGYTEVSGGNAAFNWNNGYPGNTIQPPFINPSYGIGFLTAAAAASLPFPIGSNALTYGDPDFGGKAPYYEDWSFNIQRQLTSNWMFSLAYSASAGHWLPGAAVAGPMTDQVPVQYLPLQGTLSSTLNATSLATVQAMFPNFKTPFTGFNSTVIQALKPFPQYSSVSDPWLDVGNSTYNSLQISFTHRFQHGLSVMFNYTYSKELDDLVGVRDPNKDFLEKGPGTIDHPTVLSATFLYLLPFGKGKLSAGVLNPVISHWQISSLFTYQGGAPISITGTCTGGGIIDASCYPIYSLGFSGSPWQNGAIGSGGVNVPTTVYFVKAAFTDPPAYMVGSIPRSAPYGMFAPHNADVDVSVRREFPIKERVKLAFQADAFNINNAVHFSAPGGSLDASSFGLVTGMANSPRKLQFSARVSF